MYDDHTLDRLAAQIDISNQTLIQAEAAYRQARALVRQDASGLYPTVTGGAGQLLRFLQNGVEVVEVPIPTDPYVHELAVTRSATGEGPLGTFWGIETRDTQSRTTIGNPIFLKGP